MALALWCHLRIECFQSPWVMCHTVPGVARWSDRSKSDPLVTFDPVPIPYGCLLQKANGISGRRQQPLDGMLTRAHKPRSNILGCYVFGVHEGVHVAGGGAWCRVTPGPIMVFLALAVCYVESAVQWFLNQLDPSSFDQDMGG